MTVLSGNWMVSRLGMSGALSDLRCIAWSPAAKQAEKY